VILTTTPGVDGRATTEYLGVVTGEAILGANIVRDLFAACATSRRPFGSL
jgi:uncharacterized protein YbjQ (UPF0145 family)